MYSIKHSMNMAWLALALVSAGISNGSSHYMHTTLRGIALGQGCYANGRAIKKDVPMHPIQIQEALKSNGSN